MSAAIKAKLHLLSTQYCPFPCQSFSCKTNTHPGENRVLLKVFSTFWVLVVEQCQSEVVPSQPCSHQHHSIAGFTLAYLNCADALAFPHLCCHGGVARLCTERGNAGPAASHCLHRDSWFWMCYCQLHHMCPSQAALCLETRLAGPCGHLYTSGVH